MSTETTQNQDKDKVATSYTEKDQEKATKQYLAAKAKNNKDLFKSLEKEAKDQAKAKAAAAKKPKGKQVQLIATSNLSGKYNLPYSSGDKFKIDEKQAVELVKNKDAEKVK